MNVTLSRDARSAIRRAKTVVCKKELEEYAHHLGKVHSLRSLKRKCHRDQNLKQYIEVGCLSNITAHLRESSVISLNEELDDLEDCLETCFSYGHSLGGYHNSSRVHKCLCGDTDTIVHADGTRDCDKAVATRWYNINRGIHYPNATRFVPDIERAGDTTRIAFILTLHGRSTLQVKRLLSTIYSSSHTYYIHVDNSDDYLYEHLLPLESKYRNIIVSRSRFETIWGGPQLLTALIDAFERLSQYSWTYVINLSESDFLIKPLKDLESFLKSSNSIFLRGHNLKGYKFIQKQGLDRNFYQCERRVWRLGRRKLPKGIIFSGGSDWFALPRSFTEYIIKNKNNSDDLVAPLLQMFNYTLLPAESFFHTLALNSEFCDRYVDNNLRVNNWRRNQSCGCQKRAVVDWCGCSPQIYRLSDFQRLKNLSESKDLFFARKFDSTISQNVISKVEQSLLRRKQDINLSSAYWLNVYSEDFPSDETYLTQFGALVANQISIHHTKLKTIHEYFEDDAYRGLVLELCKGEHCLQLLSTCNSQAKIHVGLDSNCQNLWPYQLVRLEVGHEFDSNERIFRNHRPLNTKSDVSVYHEWLLNDLHMPIENLTEMVLQFQWVSPEATMIVQDIVLKPDPRRSKLTFAHRLARKTPLEIGLWNLRVSYQNTSCAEQKFLVFSDYDGSVKQSDFDELFTTSDRCTILQSSDNDTCSNRRWSLRQKQLMEDKLI